MILNVKRDKKDAASNSVFGQLFLNGVYQCETLENLELLIPEGVYKVEFYNSPSFNLRLPILQGVPNRNYIEIHPANWSYQLKGCIAVGTCRNPESVSCSRLAFTKLMGKIQDQKDLTIEVE